MKAKPAKSRPVVLIVEDEPFVRLTGADLLAEAGFEVLEAGNADEAMRILEATPEVRVVFSDVEMPGSLDGLGLARNICQRWPSIGIVLTSGHRIRAETIPRDGKFLAKPYDGQVLVRHIEEIVNQ
ncbi:MAG TPA: response regulator [Methylocella sp.]|jgi:CheY-like chemotaxis protein|nr:response regulator [Methylocella sp.]